MLLPIRLGTVPLLPGEEQLLVTAVMDCNGAVDDDDSVATAVAFGHSQRHPWRSLDVAQASTRNCREPKRAAKHSEGNRACLRQSLRRHGRQHAVVVLGQEADELLSSHR